MIEAITLAVVLSAMADPAVQYFPYGGRNEAISSSFRHVCPFTGIQFASVSPLVSFHRSVPFSSLPEAEKSRPHWRDLRMAISSGVASPDVTVLWAVDSIGVQMSPGNISDEMLFDSSRSRWGGW